jgi:hypothetical protein
LCPLLKVRERDLFAVAQCDVAIYSERSAYGSAANDATRAM